MYWILPCFVFGSLSNDTLIAGFAVLPSNLLDFVVACLGGAVDQRFARRFADTPALVNVVLFMRVLRILIPVFVLRLSF